MNPPDQFKAASKSAEARLIRPHALGKWGEMHACNYWRSLGASVLAQNWRRRRGELDLVVLDQGELVACEVKTRRSHQAGTPFEAITPQKLCQLSTLFSIWRSLNPIWPRPISWRLDAIGITVWPDQMEVQHLRRVGL
jgi:putative endonuclease